VAFFFEYAAGLIASNIISTAPTTTAPLRSQELPVIIYPLLACLA
jgi:hypothetical protein